MIPKVLATFRRERLPYDYEVEYLESTGTQYIDTDISFSLYEGDVLAASFGCRYGSDFYACGCSDSTAAASMSGGINCCGLFQVSNGWSGFFCCDIGRYGVSPEKYNSIGTMSVATSVNSKRVQLILNGSAVGTQLINFPCTITTPISLFAVRLATSRLVSQYALLSNVKLTRANGAIIFDFIPVVKDGVGYMYDKVSGKLFGNSGTGSFVIGPRKQSLAKNLGFLMPHAYKYTVKDYVQHGLVALWDNKILTVYDTSYVFMTAGNTYENPFTAEIVAAPTRAVLDNYWTGVSPFTNSSYSGLFRRGGQGIISPLNQSSNRLTTNLCFPCSDNVRTCCTYTTKDKLCISYFNGVKLNEGTYRTDEYKQPAASSNRVIKTDISEWMNSLVLAFTDVIRIYNRMLSPLEIKHNYEVDKTRFNLP